MPPSPSAPSRQQFARPRLGGTDGPRPTLAAARLARRAPAGRCVLPEARGYLPAPPRRRRSGSSASMASICSTKSGFPSAAPTIRSRSARRNGRVVHQPLDQRAPTSAGLGRTSVTRLVRGLGAAHEGRMSKRSGRARQRSRIGAPPEKPSDVLEAGRVRSARPSGCRRPRRQAAVTAASASKSRLKAHAVSSGDPGSSFDPTAASDEARRDLSPLDVREQLDEARPRVLPGDVADDLCQREIRDSVARRRHSGRRAHAPPSRTSEAPPAPGGTCRSRAGRRSSRASTSTPATALVENVTDLRRAPCRGRRTVSGWAARRQGRPDARRARATPPAAGSFPSPRPAPHARRRRRLARRDSVASPTQDLALPAACSSRAATLTASPVASFWLPVPSPTTTSPVLTPGACHEADAVLARRARR